METTTPKRPIVAEQCDRHEKKWPARRGPLVLLLLVLAATLWATWAWQMSTTTVVDRAGRIKGWDFAQFYAVGRLAATGRVDATTDGPAIGREAVQAISRAFADRTFVPVYGPGVALAFAPLARLSYQEALLVWIACTLALYGGCVFVLWRGTGIDPVVTALAAVASPAVWLAVSYGQLSAVALASVTLAFVALARGKPFAAGAALGLLLYKPTLAVGLGLVLLLAGEWQVAAGAALAIAAQVGVLAGVAGPAVVVAHVRELAGLAVAPEVLQTRPHLLQSLPALCHALMPTRTLATLAWMLTSAAVLFIARRLWRSGAPLGWRYAGLLLATSLVSPHFYVYDLLILTPLPFLLVDVHRNVDRRTVWGLSWLLGLVYMLPILGVVVAHASGIPLAPLVLTAVLLIVVRLATAGREPVAAIA